MVGVFILTWHMYPPRSSSATDFMCKFHVFKSEWDTVTRGLCVMTCSWMAWIALVSVRQFSMWLNVIVIHSLLQRHDMIDFAYLLLPIRPVKTVKHYQFQSKFKLCDFEMHFTSRKHAIAIPNECVCIAKVWTIIIETERHSFSFLLCSHFAIQLLRTLLNNSRIFSSPLFLRINKSQLPLWIKWILTWLLTHDASKYDDRFIKTFKSIKIELMHISMVWKIHWNMHSFDVNKRRYVIWYMSVTS